ncbi:hypothetical protein ABTD85_22560, partial [Acinetobacter baumannii]
LCYHDSSTITNIRHAVRVLLFRFAAADTAPANCVALFYWSCCALPGRRCHALGRASLPVIGLLSFC